MVPIIYKYAEKPIIQIKPESTFGEKMAAFQTSLIMKVAVWEGIALFSCVIILQFNNGVAIIFFIISFFGILSNYPNPEKFGLKIGLTQNEIDQFKL
jgi:alpha-D-ribose 1-methylphosphonate 5-phosphate C-P lyase